MKYKLKLSNKSEYEIGQDDFVKLKENMADANMIFLKNVAINPSYIVEIIPLENIEKEIPIVEIVDGVAKIVGYKKPLEEENVWKKNICLP